MKFLAMVALTATMLYTCQAGSNLHPVILVPGSGGNQLEARLTSEYKPTSWVCNRGYPVGKNKKGWFRLWFDVSVLLAPFTECFAQQMTLYYDPEVDDYVNAPGVETRVSYFGSTASLLYLNPLLNATLGTCQASSNLNPIIIVPGAGGNQLEARLTEEYKATSLVCKHGYPVWKDEQGWFRLWFDPTVLIAPFTRSFAQRMTLYYDPGMDDYVNAPGVETRVSRFGSTESLLYLNPHLKHITEYMATLVKSLEELGYVDSKTLFGAPYDFRYGLASEGHPSRVGSKFLQDLKELIEKASSSNEGKPVILLSHSLGGLFVLQLLNRNPLSWRKKYIKQFIALSAPWGGTVQELLTFASGYSLGVPLVEPLLVRDEQRSSESNLWLMPSPKIFGRKTPLVITPNATYSAYDIAQFLEDIGYPEGVRPYKSRILPLVENLVAPEVPITCIIGSGVQTPATLFYGNEGFDKQPEMVFGDGDGTVNMVSLLALETQCSNQKNQTVKVIKVGGVSHTDILKNQAAIYNILEEITSINSGTMTSAVSST